MSVYRVFYYTSPKNLECILLLTWAFVTMINLVNNLFSWFFVKGLDVVYTGASGLSYKWINSTGTQA